MVRQNWRPVLEMHHHNSQCIEKKLLYFKPVILYGCMHPPVASAAWLVHVGSIPHATIKSLCTYRFVYQFLYTYILLYVCVGFDIRICWRWAQRVCMTVYVYNHIVLQSACTWCMWNETCIVYFQLYCVIIEFYRYTINLTVQYMHVIMIDRNSQRCIVSCELMSSVRGPSGLVGWIHLHQNTFMITVWIHSFIIDIWLVADS